jgi:hypothetical protein
MLAVDIRSCEPWILLEDCGSEYIYGAPCISPDEQHVVVALSTGHPEMSAGAWTLTPQRPYRSYLHSLRIIRIPLARTGAPEILYEHPVPAQSAHCAFSPTDSSLLYFDLDLPPGYWGGSDGFTPRIWLLDVDRRTVRPLKDRYPGPFQTHQAWLWDGSGLCYHGPASSGGEYFGVATPTGTTLWEETYPDVCAYGHLTPDARRTALILDGTFTKDRLQWLYWRESTRAAPSLEPICRHGTEWGSLPGQYSHPHPLTDASGHWISFTSARGGRSDVYVVDVDA